MIYAVFKTTGDGDGYPTFDLVCCFSSLRNAELYVEAKLLSSPAEKTSHPLFRESHIHIGSRSDSTGFLEGFGGYVIEKMHVF